MYSLIMKILRLSVPVLLAMASGMANADADILFLSKNIYTGNPELPIANSMAVSGDTITCVSATDSCKTAVDQDTVIVDNGEATIMAGMIDTHLHTRLFGQTNGVMLNLFELNGESTETIEKAIADYAATLGPDE